MLNAGIPDQMEPMVSFNENAKFPNELKSFDDDSNEVSGFDDALLVEPMDDNNSDASFKAGSDHADSSKYFLSND